MRAYARVEPFGFEMDNWRAGIIASTVARVHGGKLGPKDFYPQIGIPVDVDSQSKDEQIRILMMSGKSDKPS